MPFISLCLKHKRFWLLRSDCADEVAGEWFAVIDQIAHDPRTQITRLSRNHNLFHSNTCCCLSKSCVTWILKVKSCFNKKERIFYFTLVFDFDIRDRHINPVWTVLPLGTRLQSLPLAQGNLRHRRKCLPSWKPLPPDLPTQLWRHKNQPSGILIIHSSWFF